jgi:hypothetical protein
MAEVPQWVADRLGHLMRCRSLSTPDAPEIGAGPAVFFAAAALGRVGVVVEALSATEPSVSWFNGYGIWREVAAWASST